MVDRAGYIGLGQYFIKWWIELGTLGRDSTLSNGGYGWVHWVGTALYQMVDRAWYLGSGGTVLYQMVARSGHVGSEQYFIKWWLGLGTLGRDSTLSNGG